MTRSTNEIIYNHAQFQTVVPCTVLKNPANGTLILTGTSYGNTATYTCDTGFVLVGSEMLICEDDGMWSDLPPACQRVVGMEGNTFICLTLVCMWGNIC